MSAKRCGLASLLFNIKGPAPKLLSVTVNSELYFIGHFSGLPCRLTGNYWATIVASHELFVNLTL